MAASAFGVLRPLDRLLVPLPVSHRLGCSAGGNYDTQDLLPSRVGALGCRRGRGISEIRNLAVVALCDGLRLQWRGSGPTESGLRETRFWPTSLTSTALSASARDRRQPLFGVTFANGSFAAAAPPKPPKAGAKARIAASIAKP